MIHEQRWETEQKPIEKLKSNDTLFGVKMNWDLTELYVYNFDRRWSKNLSYKRVEIIAQT